LFPTLKIGNHDSFEKSKIFLGNALQALGINASHDLTGLKQKILAGFSQIFSFRKNSRAFRNFSSSDFVEGKITSPRALRVA
jgi:hypothetical protein